MVIAWYPWSWQFLVVSIAVILIYWEITSKFNPLSIFCLCCSLVLSELLSVKQANGIQIGIAWSLREDRPPSRLSCCVLKEHEPCVNFNMLYVFSCFPSAVDICIPSFVTCTLLVGQRFPIYWTILSFAVTLYSVFWYFYLDLSVTIVIIISLLLSIVIAF